MGIAVNVCYILASIVLLYFGAEVLVKSSSNLALRLGMQPILVGLTVVAFGTSMPELIVSVDAAVSQHSEIAIGNVVGSNLFNILIILGLSALMHPILVDRRLLKSDIPLMILATVLFILFYLDGELSRMEGLFLLVGLMAYLFFTIWFGKKKSKIIEQQIDLPKTPVKGNVLKDICLLVLGLLILVGGSQLLVEGGVNLAKIWGVSDAIIGLTIVSVGTSLPELATSVIAAVKGKTELAIGNAVGSNIFNLLGIAGTSALIFPIKTAEIGNMEFIFLFISALILWPLAFSGKKIIRWEGLLLLGLYATYLILIWP